MSRSCVHNIKGCKSFCDVQRMVAKFFNKSASMLRILVVMETYEEKTSRHLEGNMSRLISSHEIWAWHTLTFACSPN